jgi:hypothetical protein
MSAPTQAQRAEQIRQAILDFLAERQHVAFMPEVILERIGRSHFLDFRPEPDEFTAAITFLENFSPDPLIKHSTAVLGSTRFYQATSAGVLAFERGTLNP